MNVVLPPTCPVSDRTGEFVPLAVAGTVHGRLVEVLVASLDDVLAHIADWTGQDPGAIGCWGLRSDYSVPLTLPLRPKIGTARESMRTVHLVRLLPGEAHGGWVAALCGERLRILGVEVLPVGAGMPCAGCLAGGIAADQERADRVVTPRVDTPAVRS
ncbi:MAG TPA: hypothetical protein VH333_22100 [Pseudonocardiaceae bacterium]|nr:hypothetical protein [Pseudonocardiaceae bacterium]